MARNTPNTTHSRTQAQGDSLSAGSSALRDIATQFALAETRTPTLSRPAIAKAILESLRIGANRLYHLTIPAGVSDVEAMRALNRHHSRLSREVSKLTDWHLIYEPDLAWLAERCGSSSTANARQRHIALNPTMLVTHGGSAVSHSDACARLESRGFAPAKLGDIALVAAAAHLKLGEDILERKRVVGSTPGSALEWMTDLGITVTKDFHDLDPSSVVIAGTPRRPRPIK